MCLSGNPANFVFLFVCLFKCCCYVENKLSLDLLSHEQIITYLQLVHTILTNNRGVCQSICPSVTRLKSAAACAVYAVCHVCGVIWCSLCQITWTTRYCYVQICLSRQALHKPVDWSPVSTFCPPKVPFPVPMCTCVCLSAPTPPRLRPPYISRDWKGLT